MLPERETATGLAVVVAVVQHVSAPPVVEHAGILHHVAVPPFAGWRQASDVVRARPRDPVNRFGVRNAIANASNSKPHPIPIAIADHPWPGNRVFTGSVVDARPARTLPVDAVTGFRVPDV